MLIKFGRQKKWGANSNMFNVEHYLSLICFKNHKLCGGKWQIFPAKCTSNPSLKKYIVALG